MITEFGDDSVGCCLIKPILVDIAKWEPGNITKHFSLSDPKANSVIVEILDSANWEPANNQESALYWLVKRNYDSFARLSEVADNVISRIYGGLLSDHLEFILSYLKSSPKDDWVSENYSRIKRTALNESFDQVDQGGDRRWIYPIINYALRRLEKTEPTNIMFQQLFGKYNVVINKLFCGIECKITYRDHALGDYSVKYNYDTSPLENAVTVLINMKDNVSSNLLWQLVNTQSIYVEHSYTTLAMSPPKEILRSFEELKRKAIEELKKRGNPVFKPQYYLDDLCYTDTSVKSIKLKI